MRQAFTPYRTNEIIALARSTAERFRGCGLEEVAERAGIILRRIPSLETMREGFSCFFAVTLPKRFRSETNPDQMRLSFIEEERRNYPAIIINSARVHNETLVFWHEYYHIWYSPSRNAAASFFSGYSTAGVLDTQEERRANLFAAAVIIHTTTPADTPRSLAERYGIEVRFAELLLNAQSQGHPTSFNGRTNTDATFMEVRLQ